MSVGLMALCLALGLAEAAKSLLLSPAQPWTIQPIAYGPMLPAGLLGIELARSAVNATWARALRRLMWMCMVSILVAWLGIGAVLYPRVSVGFVLGSWHFLLREWIAVVLISTLAYLVVRFGRHRWRPAPEAA
jgi:hypothetical protein